MTVLDRAADNNVRWSLRNDGQHLKLPMRSRRNLAEIACEDHQLAAKVLARSLGAAIVGEVAQQSRHRLHGKTIGHADLKIHMLQ